MKRESMKAENKEGLIELIKLNFGYFDIDDLVFYCIGTDRSTGDSFGPLVGHLLKDRGYGNVLGTIHDPVHAMNLEEKLCYIKEGKIIVAIDATLGRHENIGKVFVEKGSIKPGAGVGKDLPPVGDFSIGGIVNEGGYMEFFVLQNTRLSVVYDMAIMLVESICDVFPIDKSIKFTGILEQPSIECIRNVENKNDILDFKKVRKKNSSFRDLINKIDYLYKFINK